MKKDSTKNGREFGMVQITSFAGNMGWGSAQRRLSLRESTFAERKATNRPGGRRP